MFRPVRSVYEIWDEFRRLRTLEEENRVLRQTLVQYAKDSTRLNDLEAQNERLKLALGFTESQKKLNQYIFRIAEVVGGSPDLYSNQVVINLGERDGIKVNQAVTTANGLLGRIVRVTPFYSTVQLLTALDEPVTSKGIAATAKGKESASFGLVEQYDPVRGVLLMNKVDARDPVVIGDMIVTSGLGDVFPRGIEIGMVQSKTLDEFGLTYRLEIKPGTDFRRIHEVFVVEVPEVR